MKLLIGLIVKIKGCLAKNFLAINGALVAHTDGCSDDVPGVFPPFAR